MTATAVPGLASLLSDEGWAYASLPPHPRRSPATWVASTRCSGATR